MWHRIFGCPILSAAFISTKSMVFQSSSKAGLWKHRPLLSKVQRSGSKLFSSKIKPSSSSMKQWPQPVVVSHGDYEQDAFLESVIGGPLYSRQNDLQGLPVPTIEKTLKRFLPSALPLAESEEEAKKLIQACERFPEEATKLQERLEARRNDSVNTSWLQLWWNQEGYLKFRDPVVVNVSYFFNIGQDDETLQNYQGKPMNVMRGAAALTAVAQYRKQVCSGQMLQETIGKKNTPLCSVSFKYIFHSCRIPKREQDIFKMYDPFSHKHCIVAVKGQFFAMNFLDTDDEPLSLESLEAGLMQCVELAEECKDRWNLSLGVLTAGNRDEWADNRDSLLRIGGEAMEKALNKLESGAIVLCLDSDDPLTLRELANTYWHGYNKSYTNRWYDKSIHLMCQANGKLGFFGEHSMADGMPAVGLCKRIAETKYENLANASKDDNSTKNPVVENVFGEVMDLIAKDGDMVACIEDSRQKFTRLVKENDMTIELFRKYGSNFIKKSGFSPDCLVQLALQLATTRLFGKQVATYEASQVRTFLHGRTETTRSVSTASHEFVISMGLHSETMESDLDDCTEKISLLKKAAFAHSKYLRDASLGLGCDRHFFGLSMLLGEDEDAPALFRDPVFQRSKHWRVSTSTLPVLPGFGCVVEDGVGIGYEIGPDDIYFAISSRSRHNWTNKLGHLIEEALLEIRMLIDLDASQNLKSKL